MWCKCKTLSTTYPDILNLQLIFSGFKNFPSTCYQTRCEFIIFHFGEQIYTRIWWMHMNRLKNIQICVDCMQVNCWISFFNDSNNIYISNICWVRHNSFDNSVFFLTVLLWCHVTSVKKALHFYEKGASLYNPWTDTDR